MQLRNILIKSLGGITRDEFEAQERELAKKLVQLDEQERARALWHDREAKLERGRFDQLLTEKDEEIRRLTNLILTEHGVIRSEGKSVEKGEPRPIHRRQSMRERLQQAAAEDAKAHADKVKEHWEKKNAG